MNKKRIISSILLVVTIFAIIGIFSLGIFGASDIGKMTIFSDGSGGVGGTHAFIYIENTSSSTMKVGSYNIVLYANKIDTMQAKNYDKKNLDSKRSRKLIKYKK